MRKLLTALDLANFLEWQPGMDVLPQPGPNIELAGRFVLHVSHPSAGVVDDVFEIKIVVPDTYPSDPPVFFETGGKIPRELDFHCIGEGGGLCLGSPIALRVAMKAAKGLRAFAEACFVPYLYAVAVKLDRGGQFVFGELEHGVAGIIQDLEDRLALHGREQVVLALVLLTKKNREARKCKCPCGCGKKLRSCKTGALIAALKSIGTDAFFRRQLNNLRI